MHFERLSKTESDVVREALRAAADGPFVPDWEFTTLFGVERNQIRKVADEWPLPSLPPDDVAWAVGHALGVLLYYPHRKETVWADWISVTRAELEAIDIRLRDPIKHRRVRR